MSNSVKMIVGVVAAVVIPFAAPALAGMIMASTATTGLMGAMAAGATALGTTGTSALIGAGLGAASAAATGGDVGKGALFGGLGGGLGGYASATKAAQAAEAAKAAGTAAQAGSAAAPVGTGTVLAAPTAGANAAGTGISSGFDTASYLSGVTGSSAGAGAAGAGMTAGLSVPFSPSPTATGVAAAEPQSFGTRFVNGVQNAWQKATTPENLSDMALSGGKYLAGSLAAGSGMTAAEQDAMRAQQRELRRAQEANAAVFNTRMSEGQKLINEANYYDPNYMGLQRAREAQLQSARAKQAGLRGLTGDTRQAEARRYDLGTGRATGTAYDQGYQTGITARTNTRLAGVNALPSGYETTTGDYGLIQTAATQADERRRQRARDIGNLFGDFSGQRASTSTGGG